MIKINQLNKKGREWWNGYFDEKYLKTYVDICSPLATKKQVDFLVKNLKLKSNAKILDLGCGYGRHAIALAKKGYQITGFDYSEYLLKIATIEANRQQAKLRFVQGDMRHFVFRKKFDAIISMFTTFGYFNNRQDDIGVIKSIRQSLKPNGIFLIDLNNAARLVHSFLEKKSKDAKTGRLTGTELKKLSNGLVVRLRHKFDLLKMQWSIARFWKSKAHFFSVAEIHIYNLPELKLLLESHGLCVEKEWGDYDGSPLQADSRRMIVLARKNST